MARATAAPSRGRSSGFLASIRATRASRRVGDLAAEIVDPGRVLEEDLREHGHEVRPGEGRRPGERLVEHAAEREDVRPRVDGLPAPRLLRRHVPRGPEHRPRLRRAAQRGEPRHPEVEDPHVLQAGAHEEDVAGLEVAVDDAPEVDRGQRLGDPVAHRHRLLDAEPPARQAMGEILSFEPLHHQVALPRGGHAVRPVPDQARVDQLGEELRLALEPPVPREVALEEHLHGDRLRRGQVLGIEDRAHPAQPRDVIELETSSYDVAGDHWWQRVPTGGQERPPLRGQGQTFRSRSGSRSASRSRSRLASKARRAWPPASRGAP